MSIYQKWVSYCDVCCSAGPDSVTRGDMTRQLNRAGWKIRRTADSSGARVVHLTCPKCLQNQMEEQAQVVAKIAQMKKDGHPLTSGVMPERKS